MLAILLGALSPFAAAPARAQSTTITLWSATLTADQVDIYFGCDNSDQDHDNCSSSSVLSDDDFTYASTTYMVADLYWDSSANFLVFGVTVGGTSLSFSAAKAALSSLTLNVDGTAFAVSDAVVDDSGLLGWPFDPATDWTDGQQISLSLTAPAPAQMLSVEATPACGSTVTDMSLQPSRALVLTPAPAMGTTEETEYRVVPGPWAEEAPKTLSIDDSGHSSHTVPGITFAELRRNFPGFRGFEYRLKSTPTVTVRCEWTFDPRDDGTSDPVPPPPPPGPTGGGPSPGGGAPPPVVPSDPAPDSPCGETDRVYLERFYEMTDGKAWDRDENWNSDEPLGKWFGVRTDEDGSVVSLRLSENNLSGNMPTKELLCLEDKELVELALWGNDDLSGEVPEELVLAVERAVLREIAEMLNINPGWFENYGDPYDFENWHEGVITDDERRVTGLDLTGEGVIGELPESVSELRRLGEIMVTRSSGGCALSPENSSAFNLFLLTLVVFAVLVRKRAWG